TARAELAHQPAGTLISVEAAAGTCAALRESVSPALLNFQDVKPGRLLAFRFSDPLQAELPLRYGFRLNWVTQPSAGKLEGRVGLALPAAWAARVRLTLAGQLEALLWREEDDRVRLRVVAAAAGRTIELREVRVELLAEHVPACDPLLAALLDDSPLAGFECALAKGARGRVGDLVTRLLEFCSELDHLAAAALWRAIADREELADLEEWFSRIAEVGTPQEFAEDLAWACPAAGSAVEAWTEAIVGTLLDAALEPEKFDRLRQTAKATGRLLGEPGMVALLEELVGAAGQEAVLPCTPRVRLASELAALLHANAPRALANRLAVDLEWRAASASQQLA
ncbi:MAG: hypothetical protein ACPL88_13415, partial [Bryobacteraceae bacterium]